MPAHSDKNAVIRRGYVDLGARWNGCQLHYRTAGRAQGRVPALILLHQTPSTSAMYEPLLRVLGRQFWVIALDTPGFGESDALDGAFSISRAASALAAAARLLGAEPAAWFGHHTGAALALQVAHDFPGQVERLMMSGPCLLDSDMQQRLPKAVATIAAAPDGSHLGAIWARVRAKDLDAPVATHQRDALAGVLAGKHYEAAYRAVVAVDTAAQLQALALPTLVFAGTNDPLYPQLDKAYRLLADGHKAEVRGARTFICERNVEEVARLVTEFMGGNSRV